MRPRKAGTLLVETSIFSPRSWSGAAFSHCNSRSFDSRDAVFFTTPDYQIVSANLPHELRRETSAPHTLTGAQTRACTYISVLTRARMYTNMCSHPFGRVHILARVCSIATMDGTCYQDFPVIYITMYTEGYARATCVGNRQNYVEQTRT